MHKYSKIKETEIKKEFIEYFRPKCQYNVHKKFFKPKNDIHKFEFSEFLFLLGKKNHYKNKIRKLPE